MKLLLQLTAASSTTTLDVCASVGVATLTREEIECLLELHTHVCAFQHQLASLGLVDGELAPSFGTTLAVFEAYAYDEHALETLGDEPVVVVHESFSIADDPAEIERFTVHIHKQGVEFSAVCKHSSDRVTSALIPLTLLRRILENPSHLD